ncbi:MAG: LysE family translocator [Gemmatimonadales bacterium]
MHTTARPCNQGSHIVLPSAFFGYAFATILTPGPNMMYVGTTAAQRGPGVGALAALAVVLGGVAYTLTTAIGVSAAMAAHPALFTVIRGAGILYLVFLGVRLWIRARDTSPTPAAPDAGGKAFGGGLIISLTNPQLAIFFLAFLPQFVTTTGGPVWLQLLLLGLTFNCCSLVVNLVNATLTGHLGRAQLGGVRFRQVMRAIAGTAFLVLAVKSAIALSR